MAAFDKIMQQRSESGDKNACAVIATAMLLNTDYQDAMRLLAKHGRKFRRSTKQTTALNALRERATIQAIEVRGNPCPTLAQFVRTLPKRGRFRISCSSHAVAYIDGKVYDNDGGSARKRVRWCYQVTLPSIAQTDISAMWERLNRIEAKL